MLRGKWHQFLNLWSKSVVASIILNPSCSSLSFYGIMRQKLNFILNFIFPALAEKPSEEKVEEKPADPPAKEEENNTKEEESTTEETKEEPPPGNHGND